MLVKFIVENFLSFREEKTLSMVASKSYKNLPTHIMKLEKQDSEILSTAACYGANASGKSNLCRAIEVAKRMITMGTRHVNDKLPYKPFKLDSETITAPTRFEFVFCSKGKTYGYGFVYNTQIIFEEWLFEISGNRELTYFERQTIDDKTIVKTYPRFASKRNEKDKFLKYVARGTRTNQLFLTEMESKNVKNVAPIMNWFRNSLKVIYPKTRYGSLELHAHTDQKFTNFLSSYLREAGTGIEKIEPITDEKVDESRIVDIIVEELGSDVLDQDFFDNLKTVDTDSALIFSTPKNRRIIITKDSDGDFMLLTAKIVHIGADGSPVYFDIEEESDGTQRLLDLIPAVLPYEVGKERVFIIDELDRSLHPLLTRMFLEAHFLCGSSGCSHQLIFTTHDTNLLDQKLIRRDEIWFIEKDKSGSSFIYSLSDFKVRNDLKLGRGYLQGRFGAIPFIGDIHKLGLYDKE